MRLAHVRSALVTGLTRHGPHKGAWLAWFVALWRERWRGFFACYVTETSFHAYASHQRTVWIYFCLVPVKLDKANCVKLNIFSNFSQKLFYIFCVVIGKKIRDVQRGKFKEIDVNADLVITLPLGAKVCPLTVPFDGYCDVNAWGFFRE